MLLKYRCAVNHVGYYGEEWDLDLVNAHGIREINDGQRQSHSCAERKMTKQSVCKRTGRKQEIVVPMS